MSVVAGGMIAGTKPQMVNAAPRYLGVQYLRAAAALMVVFFHVRLDKMAFDHSRASAVGAAGVDIFFVISGFIMAATSDGLNAREFLTRRIIRIVPLYWLITTMWALGQALRHNATVGQYILSLLFVPFFNQHHHNVYPLMIQGWTLNFEMVFYIVFAAMLTLSPIYRLYAMVGCFVTVLAIGSISHSLQIHFYANPIILEFAIGMAIADTMRFYGRVWSGWGAMLMAVGAFALLCAPHPENRLLSWGAPAAAIVLGSILIERAGDMPDIPLLSRLGDASYSIYLTHGLVTGGLTVLFQFFHASPQTAAPPYIVSSLTLATGFGMIVHRWVELPMTAWLRAIIHRAQPRSPTIEVTRRRRVDIRAVPSRALGSLVAPVAFSGSAALVRPTHGDGALTGRLRRGQDVAVSGDSISADGSVPLNLSD